MMAGVYLGGYYNGNKGKVPTFIFSKAGKYYYGRAPYNNYFMVKTLSRTGSEAGMHHAAPEIIAFWSE